VQGEPAPHWPVVLQVSTSLPEQRVVPGSQTPTQAPSTHAWIAHETGADHCPPSPHVWTPLFEHCFVPGAQTPAQAPLTHA
jgi:hypothetical protein